MRFAFLLAVFAITAAASAADRSFQVLLSPGVTPCTVHVNGLTAVPPNVNATLCMFDWDFGDPHAPFNTLRGFNAAHCYSHAGSYTIQLTFTDPAGQKRTTSANIVIGRDTRHMIFVAPDGSDMSPGRSPDAPARSLVTVCKKAGDDCEVLLRANCTYPLQGTLLLQGRDILITRYGDGPDPVLVKTKGGPILATQNKSDGIVIEHLKFTTPNGVQADGQAPKVGTDAIIARGRNITVRDCTFDNVDMAVNGNSSPTGLLVQNCDAPTATSLRSYLVWGQGSDQVYLNNRVANSTREHCIRTSGVSRQLVAFNTLANLDRRPGDKFDTSKGCIEIHQGEYAWIANNTVTDGDIRVGPYGGKGELLTSATDWCVIENNVVNEAPILVQVGAHHVRVRNNLIHADNKQAILIAGPDTFGRISGDLTLTNNTAVNHESNGAFLRIWGKVDGITLSKNLYVAPHLRPGPNGTFIISSQQSDLGDFTDISNNVWPELSGSATAFHFGSTGNRNSKQWATTQPVKGDRFQNVRYVDPTSQPTTQP